MERLSVVTWICFHDCFLFYTNYNKVKGGNIEGNSGLGSTNKAGQG